MEWRCCECGKGFADEEFLKKHIPENHKTNIVKILKSYPDLIDSRACPDCGKVLKTVQVLKSHIADKHKHMDQYICTDGCLGFRHKHSHDDHIAKKHSLVKCSNCANFKNEKRLKHHFNSKHCGNIEGEKKNEFIPIMSVVVLQRSCRPIQNRLESFENIFLRIGQDDKSSIEVI